MSGPARAGLFIYAVDEKRVADFYMEIAGMEVLHQREDLIVLQSSDIQLLIHKIPDEISSSIEIEEPPARRENSALKFFFTVKSIASAKDLAKKMGGEVFAGTWDGPGFIACNAMDPEGNVIQLRESV